MPVASTLPRTCIMNPPSPSVLAAPTRRCVTVSFAASTGMDPANRESLGMLTALNESGSWSLLQLPAVAQAPSTLPSQVRGLVTDAPLIGADTYTLKTKLPTVGSTSKLHSRELEISKGPRIWLYA